MTPFDNFLGRLFNLNIAAGTGHLALASDNPPSQAEFTITGRIPTVPPFPESLFDGDSRILVDIDYATIETRVHNVMQLQAWAEGRNPTLPVKLSTKGNNLRASYKDAVRLIEDEGELARLGYRVTVNYKRDYFNWSTDKIVSLYPWEVWDQLPIAAEYIYRDGNRRDGVAIPPHTMMMETGGGTVVTIKAPSGHIGVGHARCAPHDRFDKVVGRRMAFGRAVDALNEAVNASY